MKRPWWPFWVVLLIYAIVRPMFIQSTPTPITMIVSILDPVTLIGAIVLGLIVRHFVHTPVARESGPVGSSRV